jgi:hypothetical protein
LVEFLYFLYSKSIVQYLRGEGLELFESPKIPEVNESTASTHAERNYETDKEWLEYCEWIKKFSKESIDHFLKGIEIGVQLKESWLASQGSSYIWNYLHHIVAQKNFTQILPILTHIFEALKKVGHNK